MMRKRSGMPLTLGIVGLAIVGLFGLIPSFFTGTGDGDGNTNVEVNSNTESETTKVISSDDQTISGFLDIIIDGETYLVKQGENERQAMSLEEIVEKAPNMGGTTDGIQVQVARKRSSLFSAERDLEEALREAGLKDDQMLWLQEVVD